MEWRKLENSTGVYKSVESNFQIWSWDISGEAEFDLFKGSNKIGTFGVIANAQKVAELILEG